MRNRIFYTPLIMLFFVFVLTSCDNNRVYDDYIKIDKYIWNASEIASFDVQIEDTLELHDLFINIRHAQQYPYSNLWLFVKTTAPTGNIEMDTLDCILANEQGRWLGSGAGDIWDKKILWKSRVRFPYKGNFKVEYQHAMREEDLVGIMSVGLRVEKVKVKI